MRTEYNGSTVYRVYDVHPAVSIEFSGEELAAALNAIHAGRYYTASYQSGNTTVGPEEQRLDDVLFRMRSALTALRTKFYNIEGERKSYAE
jgi:hypothetical protein